MTAGVLRETLRGERRVALVPAGVSTLRNAGVAVLVEEGAGIEAGYPDDQFLAQGVRLTSREEVLAQADILLQVRTPGANPERGIEDAAQLEPRHVVIGLGDPLGAPEMAEIVARRGATSFALELLPRITRAQSMDVLSAMAMIAGYKAVLLAATSLPRLCPMMTTAAGTLAPARAFVIGAGVAGLQAIASARRLGARVEAYDVRPAVKEQIQSLGARFLELPIDAAAAEDKGGYATAQDDSFYRRQRELMAKAVAGSDIVITTAAVPGRKSPVLITADMVEGMAPGSVIVDLAAERGGNCELTRADETIVVNGVTIMGPTNLPATVPFHASQLYSRNITTFLLHLLRDGKITIDTADEITRETLVTRDGAVVNPRVRSALEQPA